MGGKQAELHVARPALSHQMCHQCLCVILDCSVTGLDMKNAGGEQALCLSLQSTMCSCTGRQATKCGIDTRQTPDPEQPKANRGGG